MISVGQTIGNYQLTAQLGEGGMGVVYLAEHPVIGRRVAMKAIHPDLSRNPEVVSRFITEAKAVNQIGNEHIVDIHDFGTTPDGEFYFVMEFLQGEALCDRLKRDTVIQPAAAIAIAAQVADALGASHQHGIVHRDLKPENIFLITKGHTQDFVKVLDFGLAKLIQSDEKVSHKTRTGSVMGTPYYMAPEQCEGKTSIDHRADIYSLGVILFEMVTGKVPFGGEGYGEIIVKHMTAAVPSPRAINPRLPAALESIILRALAKTREARFQSMEELAAALADPEAYAASAPETLGPLSGSDDAILGDAEPNGLGGDKLLAGDTPLNLGDERPSSLPSTFRNSTGELLDDLYVPRRKRGRLAIFFGVGAVLVGAAVALVSITNGGKGPAPSQNQAVAAKTAVAPEPPVETKKVRLGFKSDPPGAEVIRKDTDEKLGVTPFSVELPASHASVDFVFKKESFRERAESFVPSESGQLAVVLAAAAAPEPAGQAQAEATPDAKPAKPATSRRKPAPARKPTGRPLDEDGVLAPSF